MTTPTHAALAAGAIACLVASAPAQTDPWADRVVDFDQGAGASPDFADPDAALGSPERFTGEGVFPSSVTPFNTPFGADELFSIGEGGFLTLAFNESVTDDALNPYGIDLLIFGNAFYGATGDFSDPVAGGLFTEGGVLELSANGTDWVAVPGVDADGGFPTLGFIDETTPFGSESPGTVATDFTRPVDPGFDATGLTLSEIIAGYDGSGGGLGIDIGALGLSEISYVRISNPIGSGLTPEIDALADVSAIPAPGAGVGLLFTIAAGSTRRRRTA
ncbi:MAG: hypothetical protein ACF8Q5_08495 [Phycisphaerales bacterium JB040]